MDFSAEGRLSVVGARSRKGFTLAELTVFMAASAVLMTGIISVEAMSRRSTFTEMASLRLLEDGRSVSWQLRSDLASARSVRVTDGGRGLEAETESGTVTYGLEEEGRLVRSYVRGDDSGKEVMRGRVEEFSAMIDPTFERLVRVKLKLSRSTGARSLTAERTVVVTTRGVGERT